MLANTLCQRQLSKAFSAVLRKEKNDSSRVDSHCPRSCDSINKLGINSLFWSSRTTRGIYLAYNFNDSMITPHRASTVTSLFLAMASYAERRRDASPYCRDWKIPSLIFRRQGCESCGVCPGLIRTSRSAQKYASTSLTYKRAQGWGRLIPLELK